MVILVVCLLLGFLSKMQIRVRPLGFSGVRRARLLSILIIGALGRCRSDFLQAEGFGLT